ncbi:hypothetical protein K3495_g5365 [Podosphaera aphanis]|nr:hypothetical protein K3495_g5365 [Podosphaera aphanis]
MDGHGSHTTTEFLRVCKQNNIELLFLPAHSSHVLQPLDLGVFAPLKSQYPRQIADLAKLDNASAVKKQKFVTCYQDARNDTFNPRLLKSGWKVAGLFPWNPEKGINSSQVPPPTGRPPTSLSNPNSVSDESPCSSRKIYKSIQLIRESGAEESPRERRYIRKLHEAGRVIDSLNTEVADLQAEVALLKPCQDSNSNLRCRGVQVDPSTKFANIQSIVEVQDAQAALEQMDRLRESESQAGNN